jgi:hypothetical protein
VGYSIAGMEAWLVKVREHHMCTVDPSFSVGQRSPTGGPRATDGPRETFGGPWSNLDSICNFYVYYTVSLYSLYFNITLIILL